MVKLCFCGGGIIVISTGVSIITCTNRPEFAKNVYENFHRQIYENKELIVILCNCDMDIDLWHKEFKSHDNVQIYKLSNISLGNSLNFGVSVAKHDIVAKFDDDDYYGPMYLQEAIWALEAGEQEVVGKGSTYVYFMASKTLAIRTPKLEKTFVNFVNGSTLVVRKSVFDRVKFRDISIAEDVHFCNDCIRNDIRIYSTSKFNHVYIRHADKSKHTWRIKDRELMKRHCKFLCQTDNYIDIANGINS